MRERPLCCTIQSVTRTSLFGHRTNGDRQVEIVGKILQFELPEANARSVAAAAVNSKRDYWFDINGNRSHCDSKADAENRL